MFLYTFGYDRLLEKNRNLKEELEEYELKTGQRDAENQIREEVRDDVSLCWPVQNTLTVNAAVWTV